MTNEEKLVQVLKVIFPNVEFVVNEDIVHLTTTITFTKEWLNMPYDELMGRTSMSKYSQSERLHNKG